MAKDGMRAQGAYLPFTSETSRSHPRHSAEAGTAGSVREERGGWLGEMTMRYAHPSPEARESPVQELDRPIPQARAALG
jgi:hypothetical protein